jgi:hypothetical protein
MASVFERPTGRPKSESLFFQAPLLLPYRYSDLVRGELLFRVDSCKFTVSGSCHKCLTLSRLTLRYARHADLLCLFVCLTNKFLACTSVHADWSSEEKSQKLKEAQAFGFEEGLAWPGQASLAVGPHLAVKSKFERPWPFLFRLSPLRMADEEGASLFVDVELTLPPRGLCFGSCSALVTMSTNDTCNFNHCDDASFVEFSVRPRALSTIAPAPIDPIAALHTLLYSITLRPLLCSLSPSLPTL